jgi:Carboxypeptidase regulatory-like domain
MKLRVVLVVAFILSFAASSVTSIALQSQPQSQTEPGASIAGKVTLRGTPVSGAPVLVRPAPFGGKSSAQGKTDANGQYRITNLEPGRYSVVASALPLTSQEETDRYGREITLDRGEARENVDFSLVRGGAITGRVLEANGHPIVEEPVSIIAVSTGRAQPYFGGYQMMITDDRGVYRVYGLPPGRYKVSVGEGAGSSYRRLDQGQTYYPHTYHPGVTEEAKAGIVDLNEGGEVSGVDIVVGGRARTFEASGRILDAETGQPQPGINWGYGGNAMSTFGKQSDEKGGFKITGLMPGRYSVFAGCEGDYYMDQIEFDLTDHDVTGLEIRRHRGASISGKVVVDGVSDPAVLGKLTQVSLNAGAVGSSIDPDGSYYFCGLRPGRVKVSARSWRNSGFWLLRVERDGVDLREGIDVSPGDHVTAVRIVLAYATGVIRGQVTVPGYDLPQGVRLQINAHRLGDEDRSSDLFAETDERGRFVIEGLIAGEYELSAGSGFVSVSGGRIPRLQPVKQRVIVINGTESAVTLELKVIERPKTG